MVWQRGDCVPAGGLPTQPRIGDFNTETVIGCIVNDEGLAYDEVIDQLTSLRQSSRKAGREAPEMSVQHDLIRRRVDRRRR